MAFKLLASADLHLGKKSSSVPHDSEESATIFTWKRIVDYAVDKNVDAVVLAGDVIERDNRFFETLGPLQDGFKKLGNAGISVVMVAGNHDFDVLPDIVNSDDFQNVCLLGQNGNWETSTLRNDKGEIQLLGWSFPDSHVSQDPSLDYSHVDLDPSIPTIGLLHGEFDKYSRYAPIEISNLLSSSINVWVVGHIHKPATHRQELPLIFYPGSPHALSPKEKGVHGPWILTIDRDKVFQEQVPLSPMRFGEVQIDITNVDSETEFRKKLTGRLANIVQNKEEDLEYVSHLVYDVILTGNHESIALFDKWSQLVDQYERELLPGTMVALRKIINLINPKIDNLQHLADQPTPPGILAQTILDLENSRNTELTDKLLLKFEDELHAANSANTYDALRMNNQQYSSEDARDLVLNECRRLLSELLSQKR